MNRVILGILCGIAFGMLDAAMVVFGKHPDKSLAMLLQAFFSRFAIGFLAANVSLRLHPAISGALVGLLISLPDAFAMKSYVGILGTGLIFGAVAGWAAKAWGDLNFRSPLDCRLALTRHHLRPKIAKLYRAACSREPPSTSILSSIQPEWNAA